VVRSYTTNWGTTTQSTLIFFYHPCQHSRQSGAAVGCDYHSPSTKVPQERRVA